MKLEAVKEAFAEWRRSRVKVGPIPDRLLAMAQSLLTEYKTSEIISALRINGAKLCGVSKPSSIPKKTSEIAFAKAYFSDGKPMHFEQPSGCMLRLSGRKRTLELYVDPLQLKTLLPVLEAYL